MDWVAASAVGPARAGGTAEVATGPDFAVAVVPAKFIGVVMFWVPTGDGWPGSSSLVSGAAGLGVVAVADLGVLLGRFGVRGGLAAAAAGLGLDSSDDDDSPEVDESPEGDESSVADPVESSTITGAGFLGWRRGGFGLVGALALGSGVEPESPPVVDDVLLDVVDVPSAQAIPGWAPKAPATPRATARAPTRPM